MYELSSNPDERDIEILHALAAGQYAFGRYEAALDFLELSRLLDDENEQTFVMMSRIYYTLGNLDDALDFIDMAVSVSYDGLSERDQIFERRIRLLDELQ